jgi:CHAD domain-containing protein
MIACRMASMGQQFELKLTDGFERAGNRLLDANGLPMLHGLPALIEAAPIANAGQAKPAKSKPALLPDDATAEDAFRLTLTQCKWHIAANIPAVIERRQSEGLHQLRVGLRRLRVAFTAFGGEFRTPIMESIRLKAKVLSDQLAEARDLDVFLDSLFEPAATANGAKEAFAVLRDRALDARAAAWDRAVIRVCSPSFSSFMRELSEAMDARIWSSGNRSKAHAAKGVMAFEAPVRAVAERMLDFRLDHAKKRAKHLESLSDEQRHRLRIALKKMRYTSDFYAPLYSRKPTKKFLGRLSHMQEILGALNDVATARNILEKLVAVGDGGPLATTEDLSFAAGIVYGWQLDRANRIWCDAMACWKEFAHARPFWRS